MNAATIGLCIWALAVTFFILASRLATARPTNSYYANFNRRFFCAGFLLAAILAFIIGLVCIICQVSA